MASSRVRLCTRHTSLAGLRICGYATLRKTSGPTEGSSSAAPVFQYVGQHRKPNHKVFVWGFSFTGALGIPSFVVPDSGRKKPRKYQLTPYRLETAEQVNRQHSVIQHTYRTVSFHFALELVSSCCCVFVADLFCRLRLRLHAHRLDDQRRDQGVGDGPQQGLPAGLPAHAGQPP